MGKKTRPFIDKKTASVYHVVRRSQRDVGTEATAETLSDFVLMPSPTNPPPLGDDAKKNEEKRGDDGGGKKKSRAAAAMDFGTLEATVAAAGLLDETARTYAKYTKPMQNSGTYISAVASSSSSYSTTTGDNDTTNSNLNRLLVDTSRNTLDEALHEAMAVHEVGRMLDSIALTPDCMEEDIALALFGNFDEGQFEEIDDDFCITANRETLIDDNDDDDDDDDDTNNKDDEGGFDFERHVKMLLEKARAQEAGGGMLLQPDDDYFKGATPLHGRMNEEDDEDDDEFDYDRYDEEEEDDEEEDYYDDEEEEEEEDSLDREFNGMSSAKNNNTEQQRILCQKFKEALLEYDSDDMGDLDYECDDIGGDVPLEGDAGLEAALNEYLTEREDDILIEGTVKVKRAGGSGYSALVGRTMVHASALTTVADDHPLSSSTSLLVNVQESKRQMALDMAEADATLANPEMDLPPEEVFIDGKSYFSVTSRNPWDCESILSTYSNLDNNPVIIGRSDRRRKKKKKKKGGGDASVMSNDVIPEDGPVKIKLSNKTGLPLRSDTYGGVRNNNNNDDYDDDDGDYFDNGSTYLSINRGEARHKDETPAEKKERKMAIKEERKICRIQKKMMKEAFAEEFQRRGHDVILDCIGGNTVFRFS